MLHCSDMLDARCLDANNDCRSDLPSQRLALSGRRRTTLRRAIVLLLAIFAFSVAAGSCREQRFRFETWAPTRHRQRSHLRTDNTSSTWSSREHTPLKFRVTATRL